MKPHMLTAMLAGALALAPGGSKQLLGSLSPRRTSQKRDEEHVKEAIQKAEEKRARKADKRANIHIKIR